MSDSWIDGFMELNRPEYAGSGEAILSSLAWSLVDNPKNYDASIYEIAQEEVKKSRFKRVETRKSAAIEFRRLLDEGLVGFDTDSGALEAMLDAFRGVIPQKAYAYPAVPLTRSAAFLQDPRGAKGKENPADYARIVEQFYLLGSGASIKPNAAARKWFEILAAQETQPVLSLFENGLAKAVPLKKGAHDEIQPKTASSEETSRPNWMKDIETPYTWFAKAWDAFCSHEWRTALPRRRWCDWSSCILRTILGLGFLWEAELYRRLAEYLIRRNEQVAELPGSRTWNLLDWRPHHERITARDVSGRIRRTLSVGHDVRRLLDEKTAEHKASLPNPKQESFQTIIGALRQFTDQTDLAKSLSDALDNPDVTSAPNTSETVIYALLCRVETGSDADFYSLLARRSRRFLVVQPGPEWIGVMSSLCARLPGEETTLGILMNDLSQLGLRPDRATLVRELERAGLARNSHDADEALEVLAAF